MNKFLILIILFFGQLICFASTDKLTFNSPDGKIICRLSAEKKQLTLSVLFNGRQIIDPSNLIFKIGEKEITSDVVLVKSENYKVNESYPWNGLHSVAVERCNGSVIWIHQTASKNDYVLELKVFNDAVAFRFKVPGRENVVREPDEATVFRVPGGSTVWYHDLYMHYEGIHVRKLVDTIPPGQWAAPPLTIKLPGGAGYASITEANLVGYAGMALQTDGAKGFTVRLGHSHPPSYPYVLRYSKEDVSRLSRIAEITGTITTPWRVIIIGKDLNTLVNCDVISDLCPAPDKELFPDGIRTIWIKPGRAVWKYLDGGGDGTLSVMKKFSKEAAELGFEYNILEGFWSRWPDDSVKALVDYSNRLGVGLIVWKHSKDLRDPVKRKEFFEHLHDLGVTGVKIDFFDHEAKEVIDLYESIAKEAAALKLVLIFHGANKPTGLARTYPNILIYEGVKGMEASKLTDRATHETTIPFTRMLAGPADYTLCHYGTRRQNTTWVHQTATAAIFAAPVITYASTPANILANPCSEMVKSIPSVWDETIVLPPSEIGELAVFAQRKGTTWFLSAINGVQPKSLKIPLNFLGGSVNDALILSDNADNPASAKTESKQMKKGDILNIDLGTGGGFIARFTVLHEK